MDVGEAEVFVTVQAHLHVERYAVGGKELVHRVSLEFDARGRAPLAGGHRLVERVPDTLALADPELHRAALGC